MASGGQTGGFGNMGGSQSMGQQSMAPQYNPGMFAAPYNPPPPLPAPAPAPAPAAKQQKNWPFNIMNVNQGRQQTSAPTPAPAPSPFQPTLGPAVSGGLYQTPQTPAQGMRPSSSAPQFYQPIYQPQYQNYNMGNPYGVSQYGQSPFMGGTGEIGIGDFERNQPRGGMGFNPYGRYGQSPFMGTTQPTQSDLYAQRMMMQSGGQGYGMTQQMPSFMQGAISNFLQQQANTPLNAAQQYQRSAGDNYDPRIAARLSEAATGIPAASFLAAKGGIVNLIKK